MRIVLKIFWIMIIIMLSGCWSTNEAERMLYVFGLGIDYKDNQYEVSAQIIDLSIIARSDQPQSEAEQSAIGSASGKTLDEAIFNLYKSLDEKAYWGHLTQVIFSEEALKEGRMNWIIDALNRFVETRYQILVYSTKDSVNEVLLTVPIINTTLNLSKIANPKNTFEQDSFVEELDIRNLIISLNEPSHEAKIPFIQIKKNWESVSGKTDKAAITGVGVVTSNHFKGFIVGEKANGLQWMNNDSIRGEITFLLDEADEKSFTSVTLTNPRIKIKPIVKNDSVKFDIDVSMEATVKSIPFKVSENVIIKRLKEKIKDDIKVTYQEGLDKDIDIYRLSEHLFRKNFKEWERLKKDGKVELTEESIQLEIEIRKLRIGRKALTETIQ